MRTAAFSGTKFAVHLMLAERYGHNGDELYFIACGRNLAFGYVDHPPLIVYRRTRSPLQRARFKSSHGGVMLGIGSHGG